jgi:UDP-N-acetylglucosamine--N-acetylmuramyl-(pentapeptide) pyrophosphoryl-undecaprenol N-acetylglucosamine transferase
MKQYKFIISGGGTAGHINPALSIADELLLRNPSCKILFVGSSNRMEMNLVPRHGYNISGLWISGYVRGKIIENLLLPIKLKVSLIHSLFIILLNRPNVVIGTGGFASGPIVFIASLLGIKTLIQEQNSYAGVTNKFLSKRVNKICVAYENMNRFFDSNKIVFTGNPIRKKFINKKFCNLKSKNYFNLKDNKKTLLVLGGSNGSREINKLILNNIEFFNFLQIQLIWQCGKIYFNKYKKLNNNNIHVYDYINDMYEAYDATDFIISRAGASSISELSVVGKPVIFIPSPNVAEDHQKKNAQRLVDQNAALLIEEDNLENDFKELFKSLLHNHKLQSNLSENIKKFVKLNATNDIVDEIEKMIK